MLKISLEEIDRAFLPPAAGTGTAAVPRTKSTRPEVPKQWNRWSVASFVMALLGIPLIGIVTGPIAAILGVLGLASRQPHHKGHVLATWGILLGLAEFVGFSVYLGMQLGGLSLGQGVTIMQDAEVDPSSLEGLPAALKRAMRANVIIETQGRFGFLTKAMGSGVVLAIENGTATIVTNRHVIDLDYSGPGAGTDHDPLPSSKLQVQMLGLPSLVGSVVWIAPYGIDLALVRVAGVPPTEHVAHAVWDVARVPKIGDTVFAVGNPHGLSWTHTEGKISQKRKQIAGPLNVELIQTDASINSGNSGGGLYDAAGRLIGINTYTQDKRVAEGLGFAVSFKALIDLIPAEFNLQPRRTAIEHPIFEPETDAGDAFDF